LKLLEYFLGDLAVGTTTIHFCSLNQEKIVSGLGNPGILRHFNSPGTIPIGGGLSGGECPKSVLFSNSNNIFRIGHESEKNWVAWLTNHLFLFS
jgi:hypothetical protein